MTERDGHVNLGYLSQHQALRDPDKTAIIEVDGDAVRERTYGELEMRLDRVATMLTAMGLNHGDRFVVCAGNSIEYIEIVIGAMRAGIVPVPVNNRLAGDTIDYIIADSEAKAALVEPDVSMPAVEAVEQAASQQRQLAAAQISQVLATMQTQTEKRQRH